MVAEPRLRDTRSDRPAGADRTATARTLAGALLAVSLLTSPFGSGVAVADPNTERAPAGEAKIGDTNSLFRDAAGPLGLTPDQRERLEVISAESREQAATIRAELQGARDDLKSLLDEEKPDFESVMAQVDSVGAIETRMRKHQITTLLALRAVLSAEQRDGLIEVLKSIAARDAARRETQASNASPTTRAKADPPMEASRASEAHAHPAGNATP